jgi:4-hydroxybenzoate polyprenyltransferase
MTFDTTRVRWDNVPRAGGHWAVAYLQIARLDHWFKNVFMLFGVLLAGFYQPSAVGAGSITLIGLALLATCLVASSNYVLNEWLDGPTDGLHPQKRSRPVPSGRVRPAAVAAEWLLLGAAGLWLAWQINVPFAVSAAALWLMGLVYNVPPLRSKEWPYVDVVSEALNNPLRLLLGWFAVIPSRIPPLSLLLAYWMAGAFFMATKRLAEYRHIGDKAVAGAYRSSFRHYSEERLLASIVFYATMSALFAGIFIVRYRLELILLVPAAAGFFAFYLRMGLRPDSAAQHVERLYRERAFAAYGLACVVLFVVLMLVKLPWLQEWFNVEASRLEPLWTVDWGQ